MALQDILAAIIAEADTRITQARSDQQKELSTMREESEQRIATSKQEVAVSKQQKKQQLLAKAQTHAVSLKRNAGLQKKKALLDTLFAKVAKDMSTLSEKEVEPLLRACVKSIKGKGEIYPAAQHEKLLQKICPNEKFAMQKATNAKGGFLFVSKTQEIDFTFEYLVEHILRPKTELEASKTLFA